MNWTDALQAMLEGATVRRRSQTYRHKMSDGVYDCGTEGRRLAHAWTDDEKPVRVFVGADSRTLFVPESDDFEADDWFIEKEKQA